MRATKHKLKISRGRSGGGPLLPMTTYELCRFDDICTGMIVDPMLGFTTHKMNIRFRALSQQAELKAIVEEFQQDGNYDKAIKRLLDVDRRRVAPLVKTPHQHKLMRQHMEHFLRAFDKDSGFTIQACSRYSQEENQGGKIMATRSWRKGEKIEKLAGCIGELTPEQEKEILVQYKNDFSVIWSSRKKCSQLWLGPAAYMNHDCDPNCKFNVFGSNVTYTAIRDIVAGDELFLSYGDSFFGENNCNCQCITCEHLGRGYFKGQGGDMKRESAFERLLDNDVIKTRRRARAVNGSHYTMLHKDVRINYCKEHEELLKGSRMTRYDRKIISENGLPLLLSPKEVSFASCSSPNVSASLRMDTCPYIQHAAVCGNISVDAGDSESAWLDVQRTGKRQDRSLSSPVPFKMPRLERQADVDENKPLSVKEQKASDCDNLTSVRLSSWVDKYSNSPRLLINTASPTVHTVPPSASQTPLHIPSPQPKVIPSQPGKVDSGKATVRQSPRFRLPPPPSLRTGASRSLTPVTVAQSEGSSDNSDSGLGGMAGDGLDKSLDTNHNVHDATPPPPVLEPEVPYDSVHPPPPILHRQDDAGSEEDGEVEVASSLLLPPRLTIKLHHPDQVSKRQYCRQLRKENKRLEKEEGRKCPFVHIKSVKGLGVVKVEKDISFLPPAWHGSMQRRSLIPPVRLPVTRCKLTLLPSPKAVTTS